MATAEGAEGAETEKTPAERLFEAARDGDVAALDALLPDTTAEQLHESTSTNICRGDSQGRRPYSQQHGMGMKL